MNKILRNKILIPLSIAVAIIIVVFLILDNLVMPAYVQKNKITKVPNVIGLSLDDAKSKLSQFGLEPKVSEYKPDKRYKVGIISQQTPSPDTEVKTGRGIYLVVSGGEKRVVVPNLQGKSIREAEFNLEQIGLKRGMLFYEPSDEYFMNTIIRQEPLSGIKVVSGTSVDLTVSQGKATDIRVIPDVISKTYLEAEKIINNAGFKVGTITYQDTLELIPNTVLDQNPRSGEIAQMGKIVDILLSKKPVVETEKK